MMFKKGDLVRWYPDYDNDVDYKLAYFDSYAKEDPTSCYIYEVNNTLVGFYTDIERIQAEDDIDEEYQHSLEAEINSEFDWMTGEKLY